MLVLSRRPNQKVLFPGVGASVQVVSVKGNVVRLGIDAPPGVAVFREELVAQGGPAPAPPPAPAAGLPRELAHALRNRVSAAAVGLALLRKQRELGLDRDCDATLDRLDREVEAMRQQVEGAAPAAPALAAPARRRKVLLVEDDGNERELLAGLLRLFGLEVVTAEDGIDALQRLREGAAPDAVLLDMGLPRCDGPETVRQIRLDPARAGLKVFAVTGRAAEEFAGGAAGLNGWFQKPVNPQHLLRELERELAGVG
jgi:two-component system OmpR family response regulator